MLRNDDINCCKEDDLGLGVSIEEILLLQSKEMCFQPGMVIERESRGLIWDIFWRYKQKDLELNWMEERKGIWHGHNEQIINPFTDEGTLVRIGGR